jgi:hypothetical protein
MTEFAEDELYLKGRLQVATALGALAYTGINPTAAQRLQTLLDVHGEPTDEFKQNDLVLYLRGEVAKQEKSDIEASLIAVEADELAPTELKVASGILRDILK